MIRASDAAQSVIAPSWGRHDAGEPGLRACQALQGLAGSAVADRFCAWAGRSGRRYIFSVFRLDARGSDVPLAPNAIALMVRRPAAGPRRVLWAERIETQGTALAVLRAIADEAGPEAGEVHLHFLSVEAEARRAAFADLAFPLRGSLLRLAG